MRKNKKNEDPVEVQEDRRQEFAYNGYVIFKQVINRDLMAKLGRTSSELMCAASEDTAKLLGNIGVVEDLPMGKAVYLEFLASDLMDTLFRRIGFEEYNYWSGYLISKLPGSNGTYWHQDWIFWNHEYSYHPQPYHINVMVYLTDTTVANGALRVLPGSHHRTTSLHDHLGAGHDGQAVWQKPGLDGLLFDVVDEEVTLETQPGDILVMDARTLHSTHSNKTEASRILMIMEFLVNYSSFPGELKAASMKAKFQGLPKTFEPTNVSDPESYFISYSGEATPETISRKIDLGRWRMATAGNLP